MMKKKRSLGVKMILETDLNDGRGHRTKKKLKVKNRIPLSIKLSKGVRKKIKRLMKYMTVFTLTAAAVMTVGCAPMGYVEPEEVATVSAIGFDSSEGGVRVSVQTAEKGGESVKVISGEGESVSFALSHLSGADTRRLELSHCAVIVLGNGVTRETVGEIFDFCARNRDITDAVLFVAAHDANELLSLDSAAGFDMVSAMRPSAEGAGMFSKNRFYEIKNAEDTGVMALPYFFVSGDEYSLHGLKLYTELMERAILDRSESALYLMMRGIFTSGRVDHLSEEKATTARVKSARTRYAKDGDLLTVSCRLTVDGDMTAAEITALAESCRLGAEELYGQLTSRYGDVFVFGEGKRCEFIFEVDQ